MIFWTINACTIALGVGLEPDEITPLFDIKKMLEIKKKYDAIVYDRMENKTEMLSEVHKYLLEHEEIDSKDMK